jgi:hypothetical protein
VQRVAVPNSHRCHEHREEDEVVGHGSIKQSHDLSPKTWWPPFTQADELIDDSVPEVCSPYSRVRGNWDRKLGHSRNSGCVCVFNQERRMLKRAFLFISQPGKPKGAWVSLRREGVTTGEEETHAATGNCRNSPHNFPL